jgi:DNA invertase Pin-like site-specific DNA recombinase
MKAKKTAASAGFVAYYRVSTDKQGVSSLGLDAQRASVARFLGKAVPLAEFTEIESGKSHLNRPQLQAAVAACKRIRAKLVIAKLDRLARNVHFISGLMESGVDFVAVDLPSANKLTIHVMAAMAEHEREMISERTKSALAEAKKRGVQLGNPRWRESIGKAIAAHSPRAASAHITQILGEMRAQRKSLRQIAAQMNALGLKTPSGGRWYASTARAALLKARPALAGALTSVA